MKQLIIEIGVEEMPSSVMKDLNIELDQSFASFLKQHRWEHDESKVHLSPRRMVFSAQGLKEQQTAETQKVKGPPLRIALDDKGNPTQALKGFLSRCGTDQWHQEETPQGAYCYATVTLDNMNVATFFTQVFAEYILRFPFKKKMRWGNYSFIRPVRWICAYYDSLLLPLELLGVKSESFVRGLHGQEEIPIQSAEDYWNKMKEHQLILDMQDRIDLIRRHLPLNADPQLVEENANRTESPFVLEAAAPSSFSGLPHEIVYTVISNQMKCFPREKSREDKSIKGFLLVMNGQKDKNLVRKGFEKVITARLNDAKYFYEQDMKTPLSEGLEKLKSMIFMEQIGSIYDKVHRLVKIAEILHLESQYPLLKQVLLLMKNDLSTSLVAELPELQGVLGRIYAENEKVAHEVADAIQDHYHPRSEGDPLPHNELAVLAGALDRADTLSGAAGWNIPFSGSVDPMGLRRCLNGLIRIFTHCTLPFEPKMLFESCYEAYKESDLNLSMDKEKFISIVDEWFSQKVYAHLSQHWRYDMVQASMVSKLENPKNIAQKVQLLSEVGEKKEFRTLCESYTRIQNIVKKKPAHEVQFQSLEEDQERNLYESFKRIEAKLDQLSELNMEMLNHLFELNQPVEDFFEHVFVMSEDENIRKNRCSLLYAVKQLINRYFDLSRIVFEGGKTL